MHQTPASKRKFEMSSTPEMSFSIISSPSDFENESKELIGFNKTSSNYIILYSYVFKKIYDESFAKALRIFETCVLVNNNLCGKLVSSLESTTTFDEGFKVT